MGRRVLGTLFCVLEFAPNLGEEGSCGLVSQVRVRKLDANLGSESYNPILRRNDADAINKPLPSRISDEGSGVVPPGPPSTSNAPIT